MTRSRHVTPGRTTERLEKIRKLITALQAGPRTRADIGALLEMGPSGVRKYLADLAGRVKAVADGPETHIHLVMRADQVDAYLGELAAQAAARPVVPPRSPEGIAARDPRRHFHIMSDDEHYAIRVLRKLPDHDPVHVAFFGAAPARMEARA